MYASFLVVSSYRLLDELIQLIIRFLVLLCYKCIFEFDLQLSRIVQCDIFEKQNKIMENPEDTDASNIAIY